MSVELGTRVRDRASGAEGVATNYNEWINGCVRIGVQQALDEDGKKPQLIWIDEEQLETVGGPMPTSVSFAVNRRPQIALGSRVQDVSGLVGVVMAWAADLSGGMELCLQPEADKNGKQRDTVWVAEGCCYVMKEGAYSVERERAEKAPAGPRPDSPEQRIGE